MKPGKLIIGLMSGTSVDGIDAVLLRVRGSGLRTRFTQVAYREFPFPRGLKELILKNSQPETSRVDEIARLNFLLPHLYADAVKKLARSARVKLSAINLIGSHGQTIQHLPAPTPMFGHSVRATLQIGDPSVLATLTGITTVGNFRVADMAVGGEGAPLVPYFDWLVFRSRTKNRVLLNIGGIANMTVLPRSARPEEVIAFDTGPGNMVVDALMEEFFGERYDQNGRTAMRGHVIDPLLSWMTGHPFLKRKPPKSTGREDFGKEFVQDLLTRAGGERHEDIVATATEFTGLCIADSFRRFIRARWKEVDQLLVSGGGAKNPAMLRSLRSHFPGTAVDAVEVLGVPADAKEAICFAILANETIHDIPTNLPSVTGARRRVVLGTIARPQGRR